jgi:hypothetical protein
MNHFLGFDFMGTKTQSFRFLYLGDLPILTETALKIATDGCNRIGGRAREKMIKGLFLDRVHMLGDHGSIGMGVKDASLVLPDLADTKFSLGDDAVMAA